MSFCISAEKCFRYVGHLIFVLSFRRQIYQMIIFGLKDILSSAVIKKEDQDRRQLNCFCSFSSYSLSPGAFMGRVSHELPILWHQLLDSQKAKLVPTTNLVGHILTMMPGIQKFSELKTFVVTRGECRSQTKYLFFSSECFATTKYSFDKTGPDNI